MKRALLIALLTATSSVEAQRMPDDSLMAARLRAYEVPPIYKDPELASLLGFMMVGGGQFYAHRWWKGVLEMAVAGAAIYVATKPPRRDEDPSETDSRRIYGLGVAVGVWYYGLTTAGGDARAYNRRLRDDVRAGRYGPTPP